MSEETEVSEGEIREAISMRAGVDKSFRTALKEDAKAAIEEFIGNSLPEGLDVVVVEDSSSKTHIIIPESNDELTDEQLEAIAGGISFGGLLGGGAKFLGGLIKGVPGIGGGSSGGSGAASGGGGGGGIQQSGQNNTSCIGKGGLVNSSMKVSGGSEVS